MVKKCEKHPRYMGKREPNRACIYCWQFYVSEEKHRWHEARNKYVFDQVKAIKKSRVI